MAKKKGGASHAPGKTRQEREKAARILTIAADPLETVKANRRASREVAIENGTYRTSGNGVHGKTKEKEHRATRAQVRRQLRRGSDE